MDDSISKCLMLSGAILAFMAVAAGAFGAHFLRKLISVDALAVFEIGVRYQMYHALALFAVAWASQASSTLFFPLAGYLFIAGIILFSGSLYCLALTGVRWWGAITPFGGMLFLAGWLCVVIGAIRLP